MTQPSDRSTYLSFLLRIAAHLTSGDLVVQVGNAAGPGVIDFAKAILGSGAEVQHYVVDPLPKTVLVAPTAGFQTRESQIEAVMEGLKPFYRAGHSVKLVVADYWSGAGLFAPNSADLVFLDVVCGTDEYRALLQAYLPVVAAGGYLAGNGHAILGVAEAVAAEFGVDAVKVESPAGWPYWFFRKRFTSPVAVDEPAEAPAA